MADVDVNLTIPEAGFVLGRSGRTLNQAIDRGEVFNFAKSAPKAKAPVRRLGQAELRYFALESDLRPNFTPAGRRRLYQAIKRLPPNARAVRLGPMALELGPVDEALDERLRRLGELKAAVTPAADGEAMLKGAAIPVYAIAGLARGQTVAEILEDYPSLTEAQVQTAIDYAQAYPKSGRPYPAASLKRMIAAMATSGLLDVEPDDEAITPAMFR
jgi:uncharacterized protein (DUF433 family)